MDKNYGIPESLFFTISAITLFATVTSGSMTEIGVDDLAREADVIAIGSVKEVDSHLTGASVYTYTSLSVEKYIKGNDSRGTLTVTTEGGCDLGFCVWVEDTPAFTKNETVLVFLNRSGNEYSVAGWAQGKYIIEEGSIRSGWDNRTEPLENFIQRIRDAISTQKATMPAATKGMPGFEALFGILGLLAICRKYS